MMKYKFTKSTIIFCLSLALAAAIFSAFQYSSRGVASDPDGFYHAKASQLLASGQLSDRFPWLAETTWKDGYANQHYLYHLALAPFNTVGKLPWSIVVFGMIFSAVFMVLLSRLKVAWKIWWLILLLLGSVDFMFRINIVKANSLSLALMLLSFILLIDWQQTKDWRKLVGLAAVSFVFVWTYGGFVFLPVLVGTFVLAVLLVNRQFNLWPVVAVGGGLLLGLLLHPHSSNILMSLSNQLFQTGLGAGTEVPAGNEWLPYDLKWFIKSDIIVLFVWLFSLAIAVKNFVQKERTWTIIWFQINAVLLLSLALWHRRFIEYFIPYAIVAAAVTLSPYLEKLTWENFKSSWKHWQVQIITVALVIGLIFIFRFNIQQIDDSLRSGTGVALYKDAAEAVSAVSEPGEIILSTQWDQFPQLWYWNSHNYYLVGLDPTFMYLHDPDKYWAWRLIADDNPEDWANPADIHSSIKQQLGASFVFSEISRNPDFIEYMDQNTAYFEPFYSSEAVTVYRVK